LKEHAYSARIAAFHKDRCTVLGKDCCISQGGCIWKGLLYFARVVYLARTSAFRKNGCTIVQYLARISAFHEDGCIGKDCCITEG
jgi:hypothetical protein